MKNSFWDSAHDAYAVYDYCRRENITPFIDLNPGHTGHFTYKDDFTIDDDGVPICKLGLRMHKDGYEAAKHRAKYRCPKPNRKNGRLYGIMMLQHLDAWEMPSIKAFQESLLGFTA